MRCLTSHATQGSFVNGLERVFIHVIGTVKFLGQTELKSTLGTFFGHEMLPEHREEGLAGGAVIQASYEHAYFSICG